MFWGLRLNVKLSEFQIHQNNIIKDNIEFKNKYKANQFLQQQKYQSKLFSSEAMFSICNPQNEDAQKTGKQPQPLKFRFLKSINLLDILLQKFALPKKKQPYSFKRQYLSFIDYEHTNNVPIIHFPATNPKTSIIMVYCHGAGSTLNNVFNLGAHIRIKYAIGFAAYDYTGEGQSQREFNSYESDIKIVLSWVVKQGYDLRRTILCGFSLGSYSTLCLQGVMPRILISPFSGIIPLIQDKQAQYEGQMFDNIQNAGKLRARVLLLHGRKELIPVYHSRAIMDSLLQKNDIQFIDLVELQGYDHKTIPNFLVSSDGEPILIEYLKKVFSQAKAKEFDSPTIDLLNELDQMGKKILVKKTIQGTKGH